jgi:hypothetical protein
MGTALRILLVVVALVMLAGIYAVQWVQARLLEAGVQRLEWSEIRLSGRELSVGAVSGLYSAEQGELEFSASNVRLVFVWDGGPRFHLIDLGDLDLDWEPAPLPAIDPLLLPDPATREPADQDSGEQQLPDPHDWFSLVDHLPQSARIRRLSVRLPCHGQVCTFLGDLSLDRDPDSGQVDARLGLLAETERLDWTLRLERLQQAIGLTSRLALSGVEALSLASRWEGQGEAWHWQGQLELPGWAGNDWVFDVIRPWLSPDTALPQGLPSGLMASAQWSLTPGREPRVARDLLAGDVTLDAQGELPQPWVLDDVGRVQGRLALMVEGREGRWRLHRGEAGMHLDQPTLPALEQIPAHLRPTALRVSIQPEEGASLDWQASLPLDVTAALEGPVRGNVALRVLLSSSPSWSAELQQGQLELNAPRIEHAPLVLSGTRLRLPFTGQVDEQLAVVRLGQAALITASRGQVPDLGLDLADLRLALPGLTARIPLDDAGSATLQSRVQLGVTRLEHPSLLAQGWTLNGELRQGDTGLGFTGSVAGLGGLGLDIGFDWPADRPWRAEVRLQDIFLRAANPLKATFADWPPLLSLATGRVTGRFELVGNPDLQRVTGRLDATGLGGIHDRVAFEGLGLPLEVSLRDQQLELGLPGLSLASYDPGIPLGPAAMHGRYLATLDTPLAGRLEIEHATLGLLGGRLVVEPATLDLAQDTQELVVGMEGLQLARLFEVYPAEGLAGHGTLDGRLPVRLEDGRLMIAAGRLEAREPGGVLQYRTDKLREMGRANPGMRELALALDDFRYTVLASDLDYGSDGVLILGLRLEGSNPDLQGGRPVHLNVRLEEDIPALLASLQLSGQVSDIIQKRVQERLLQRRLGP